MSKFQDYIPQAMPIYRGLANYPGGASSDVHYQNYQLFQTGGDLATFKYALPTDGTNFLIPPMFVKRAAAGPALASFGVYKLDGSAAIIFLSMPTTTTVNLDATPVYEALVISGQRRPVSGLSVGVPYYFKFSDGILNWYSEVFELFTSGTIPLSGPEFTMPNVCNDGAEWIQLQYSNPCVISETIPNDITFVLNLQATVSRPQYKYVRDAEDDGQGGTVTTFQRLDKQWEFFIVGPEYLSDALVAVQMFTNIGIVFQYGDTVECSDVEVETEPQNNGVIKTTFRFTSTFLSKTACCG